jgi:hypothetical protein
MRVMVIVKATKESEAEDNPFDVEGAAEMFEAMGKYNEELVNSGIMLAGAERELLHLTTARNERHTIFRVAA